MVRFVLVIALLCAVALVAQASKDDGPKVKERKSNSSRRNPCDHCAKCSSKDHHKNKSKAKCHKCEDGYFLKNGFCQRKPCVCPKNYAPVCGKDGKTYSNACLARCTGTSAVCKGACPCAPHKPPVACPLCHPNPCAGKRCPRHPDASCRIKECSCDVEFVLWNHVVDCTPFEPPVIKPPPSVCPYGVPLVHCFADPCLTVTCPAFPDAVCKANFCGGCHADFFIKGRKVNCQKCHQENQRCKDDNDCCGDAQCCKDCLGPSAYYGPPRQGVCKDWCPNNNCHRWL